MKFLSFIFLIIYISLSKIFAQVDLPQAIIVPTGSLGEVSDIRKKILEKTLESSLDDYFAIVPKDLFEEAQEKAFEELDYEECTEEQCIVLIKEMLQVENSFQLVLMAEGDATFLSLNWNDLDRKRVEEDVCQNCDTIKLRESISSLVKSFAKEFQEKEFEIEKDEIEEITRSTDKESESQYMEKNIDQANKNLNLTNMKREYGALFYNASNENYKNFIEKYKNSEFAKVQIKEIQKKLNQPTNSIFKRRKEYNILIDHSRQIAGCSLFCEEPLNLPKFRGNFHLVKYKRIQISASDFPWISSGITIDDKSKYIIKMFGHGETKNCNTCKLYRNGARGIRYKIGDNKGIFDPRFRNGQSTILYFNNIGEIKFTYKDWKKWPPQKSWYQDNSGEIIIDLFLYEKENQDGFFNLLKETKKINPEDKNMMNVNL